MVSVKRIEGSTVHRIQSGQVVVDLSSAVKELVENAIDAGATSIDVRFKNYGLDAIEVQDNGSGIAKDDFESIALKHYTSKLNSYDDLEDLHTYGFRGEALSSLCAVSTLHVTTARQNEAPQGTRLEFESSGALKSTAIVACQQGTTVSVENIFRNLIVRRKDLEKNIKREYAKALNLLQAYACVCTEVGLAVSNTVTKQKKDVFRTRSNQSSRENIANVFGAKTLTFLVSLDLKFEMKSSDVRAPKDHDSTVQVTGHISAPIWGGGRLTSDRQLFYVNSRPCLLPQFVKVFNEVYKSYNMSQSPFIFANIILDTNAYDVNVSPDKRTIMLHDQSAMLDSIRSALTDMFESQQQSVPQAAPDRKLSSQKLSFTAEKEKAIEQKSAADSNSELEEEDTAPTQKSVRLIAKFAARGTRLRSEEPDTTAQAEPRQKIIQAQAEGHKNPDEIDEYDDVSRVSKAVAEIPPNNDVDEYDDIRESTKSAGDGGAAAHVRAFNARLAEIQARDHAARIRVAGQSEEDVEAETSAQEELIPSTTPSPVKDQLGVLPNAFNRMRPMRVPAELATITIGDKTTTTMIGSQPAARSQKYSSNKPGTKTRSFGNKLTAFMAPGSSAVPDEADSDDDDEVQESDPADSVIKLKRRQPYSEAASGNGNNHQQPLHSFSVEADDSDSARTKQRRDSDGSTGSNNTVPVDIRQDTDKDITDDLSDSDYVDDETKKAQEDRKVSQLIEEAEARSALPTRHNTSRNKTLLGGGTKDSTVRLNLQVSTTLEDITKQFSTLPLHQTSNEPQQPSQEGPSSINDPDAESHLSITVSKSDFLLMRIVGQFNLGFILAVRPRPASSPSLSDELFIIDQHASDEKYNFERLQRTTTLQHQRLVRPQTLSLTAIEEEILSSNTAALRVNGFHITTDDSLPVGQRTTLYALPTSREVTFSVADLEELLSLLSMSEDSEIALPTSTLRLDGKCIPRPSKVRKLFAMRACRSSIMIGRTLTYPQMCKLVANMGAIDKPWNCPHGRPTMRHLRSLGDVKGWLGQEDREEGVDWEGWLDSTS